MLYTPGEICSKIEGINPRMIADMAEKGLVEPAKDSSGGGTSRLYDKEGIFKIMLLSAMRGLFSLKTQKVYLNRLLLSASKSKTKVYIYEDLRHSYFPDSDTVVVQPDYNDIIGKNTKNNPKAYITHVLDVKGISDFVNDNF